MQSPPVPGRSPALAPANRAWQLLQPQPGRDDSLAVLDGFFGDALALRGSALAIPMTARSGGGPLPLDHDGLARRLRRRPRGSACV